MNREKSLTVSFVNYCKSLNYKIAIAYTGGGSEIVPSILNVSGASSMFNLGICCYSREDLARYIKYVPTKYVSEQVANDLSRHCYSQSLESKVTFGITASLWTDGQREDRVNEFYCSIKFENGNNLMIHAVFNKNHAKSRFQQNIYLRDLIFSLFIGDIECVDYKVFSTVKVVNIDFNKQVSVFRIVDGIILAKKNIRNLKNNNLDYRNHVLYPGSFNPIHTGHLNIAKKVSEITGKKILFEISSLIKDKGIISDFEISNRMNDIDYYNIHKYGTSINYDIVTTDKQFISDKITELKVEDVILGYDTYIRLCNDTSIELDHCPNVRFFVVSRGFNDETSFLKEFLSVQRSFNNVVIPIFMNEKISSTEIRNKTQK